MDAEKLKAWAGDNGDEGDEAEHDAEEVQEEDAVELGPLFRVFEEFAEDIVEKCDELDPDLLKNPESDLEKSDEQILTDGVRELPRKFLKELGKVAHKMDAGTIAKHLAEEDMVDSPDVVAGWIQRACKALGSTAESEKPEPPADEAEED